MLKLENFSYSYPQKDLYEQISFTLEADQHAAFIGVSGSGKSTLLEIIRNPEPYMYEGKLLLDENSRIGYVSQFVDFATTDEVTVFDYIAQDFLALQDQLAQICTQMESATDLDALLVQYQDTLDAYEAIGGDSYENIISKKLGLANLSKHTDLTLKELSGGECKLVQVIKEMINNPSLLLMDEPDAFLDFSNLNALKNLINAHKGTLLVITHNRYLLNHCFNKILHLENKELQEFEGSYIDYNFSLLETKIELQELAQADNEEIERNNKLIEKLREQASSLADPSKGKSLRARVKIQERLEARRIKAPFLAIHEPAISLTTEGVAQSEAVLRVKDYEVAFDEVLLQDVDFEIGPTDKVALIGPNGTGKTTLLRAIVANDNPAISYGGDVEVGYLSQIQGETLTTSATVRELFLDLGFPNADAILDYIVPYGLQPGILDQVIGTLSGGEKTMLQLAKLSLQQANFLLLDEPTSHLDTYAQIALEKAITNYNGALLMVSHDFYTIVNCMDFALFIEDKTVRKVSMRKFRKMIYASHFDKDYLALEQKKKEIETKIELALKNNEFAIAKVLCEDLAALIKQLPH